MNDDAGPGRSLSLTPLAVLFWLFVCAWFRLGRVMNCDELCIWSWLVHCHDTDCLPVGPDGPSPGVWVSG